MKDVKIFDRKNLIGRGKFTFAYREPSSNEVILRSICQVKEAMSFGFIEDKELFPIIDEVSINGEYSDDHGYHFYKMKYYPQTGRKFLIRLLDEYDRKLYRALRKMFLSNGSINQNEIEHILKDVDIEVKHKEAIIQAMMVMRNYSEGDKIIFEISPRNVAIHNGKLILLDCIFIR